VPLEINFDTTKTEGDKSLYPFITDDSHIPPPEPQSIGTIDAYGGSYGVFFFYNSTHASFGICEHRHEFYTFEYNYLCENYFTHGQTLTVDLDVQLGLQTQRNFSICFDPEPLYFLEYNYVCATYIQIVQNIELALETYPKNRVVNFNLMPVLCPYKAPNIHNIIFEMGGEILTNSDDSDPYDFTFNSSDEPINLGYDIAFGEDWTIFDMLYEWDFAHAVNCVSAEATLDTQKTLELSHDFVLCPHSTFTSTVQLVNDVTELADTELTRLFNEKIIIDYGVDDSCKQFPIKVDFLADVEMDFQLSFASRGTQAATLDLDLFSGGVPNPNLELSSQGGYGKNLNWNFKLCPSDSNPALDVVPHNFYYHFNYDYECSALELVAYHGADVSTSLGVEIIFDIFNAYSGAYQEAFEIEVTPYFETLARFGAYSDFELDDNPVKTLEVDYEHGSYSDADFTSIIVFTDVDAYSGAYVEHDLDDHPAPTLEIDEIYNGQEFHFEWLTAPVIYDVDAEHGQETLDFELDIFPSIELDVYAESGQNAVLDTIIINAILDMDALHGSESDLELTDSPSEGLGVTKVEHGSEVLTLTLNTTYALYPEAFSGASTQLDYLNNSGGVEFEYDFEYGEYVELDFSENLPAELDSLAEHGLESDFELQTARALYPRAFAGQYLADFQLVDNPSQEMDVQAYNGANAWFDTLDEFNWINNAYHGGEVLDVFLNVGSTFAMTYEHNSDTFLELSFEFVALVPDIIFGSEATFDIDVPLGEGMSIVYETGSNTYMSFDVIVSASLVLDVYFGSTLRDGWGGVGGINFCNLTELDPDWGDVTVRPSEYETLEFEFDDQGFRVWNVCNNDRMGIEDLELAVNKRFEVEFSHGSVCESLGLDKYPLTGFDNEIYPIPNEVLYNDQPTVPYSVLSEIQVDLPASYSLTFELEGGIESSPFVAETGIAKTSDLFLMGETARYREIFTKMNVTSWMDFVFENIEYIRFCPGYIIPIGNNVTFDFGNELNFDCIEYSARAGEECTVGTFSSVKGMKVDYYSGSRLDFTLTTFPPWLLRARLGFYSYIDIPEFSVNTIIVGSYVQGTWYVPPILGWGGEHATLESFYVPIGLGLNWHTPVDSCLINEWKPLDENGDPITEDIPIPTMEMAEFEHQMDARCYTLPLLVTENGETGISLFTSPKEENDGN